MDYQFHKKKNTERFHLLYIYRYSSELFLSYLSIIYDYLKWSCDSFWSDHWDQCLLIILWKQPWWSWWESLTDFLTCFSRVEYFTSAIFGIDLVPEVLMGFVLTRRGEYLSPRMVQSYHQNPSWNSFFVTLVLA